MDLVSLFARFVRQHHRGRILLGYFQHHDIQRPTKQRTLKTMATCEGETRNQRKYLIVGLCNHGMPETRHSVGLRVVERLASDLNIKWTKYNKECAGFTARFDLNEWAQIILLKPKKLMNINGSAVDKTVRHFSIDKSDVFLIHDDLDRAVGKVSIKEEGSAGGHNGVKSVISCLRTDKIVRVRVGIGRPSSRDNVIQYVLDKFSPSEQEVIQEGVVDGIRKWAWHMEGRGEDVGLLTNIYGQNPKLTPKTKRKPKDEDTTLTTVHNVSGVTEVTRTKGQ